MYERILKNCVRHVLRAVRHLHEELKIVHTRIKSDHILYTSNFVWKICGFSRCDSRHKDIMKNNGKWIESQTIDTFSLPHDIKDLAEVIFQIAYAFF